MAVGDMRTKGVPMKARGSAVKANARAMALP